MPITQLKDEYVITTRIDDQISAGADAATKKLDQLEAAATRTSAAFASANQASAAAAAGFQAMVVPLVSATKAHEGFQLSTRETNVILRELTLGFGTIGTAILSGIPPMQAFITSVESVGLHIATSRGVIGGLREEFALLSQSVLFWPIAGVAAVGAGLVALGVYAESTARNLATLAISLSGSRDDFDETARTMTRAALLTANAITKTATDIAAAQKILEQSGQFHGTAQDLANLRNEADAVAAVMGTTLVDSAKLYALAMRDPIAAINELAKSPAAFKLIDAATLETARQLSLMGHDADATALIFDKLKTASRTVAKEATPLQTEWKKVAETFQGASTSISHLGESFSHFFALIAGGVAGQLKDFIDELNGLIDLVGRLPAWMRGGAPPPAIPGQPGAPATGSSGLPGPTADLANQIAGGRSFTPALAEVFRQVIMAESGGSQYGPTGGVQIPGGELPAGTGLAPANTPVGITQIKPETAAGVGYSASAIMTPGGNIAAGGAELSRLYQKYQGNFYLTLAAYNWGEGNVDAMLRLPESQQQFPVETSRYISGIMTKAYLGGANVATGGAPPTPEQIKAAATGGATLASTAEATAAAAGGSGPVFGPVTQADLARQAEAGQYGADQQAKQVKEYADQLRALNAQLGIEKKAIADTAQPTEAQLAALNATARSIALVTEQKRNAEDPTRQLAKAEQDHIDQLRLESPADRDILALRQKLSDENIKQGKSADLNAQQQALVNLEQAKLQAGLEDTIRVRDRDTANVAAQIAAYADGRREVNNVTIAQQAEIETMKSISPAAANYTEELKKNTDSLKGNKEAHEQLGLQSTIDQLKDQIEYIQAETAAIGENTVTAQANLAMLREYQVLRAQGHDMDSRAVQDTIALTGAVSAQKAQFDLNRASANELASDFTNAFDTIGNAITQSFVQGTGAAVNWGNVMKSVLAQVIQEFLKLAILNPLLNGLFGQANVTLGSVVGVAGSLGGGGGVGAYGGGGGLLQQGIGGLTSFFQQGIGGLSQTELLGSTAGMSLEDASSFGSLSSASPGILGGASIGGLATGLLGGFGLGSLAGGALQRSLGKTGPGPQIGAGVGAAAGALAGTFVFPVIGTLLGAVLGGLLGGGGGGLIGPKAPQPFSLTDVGITSGGLLETGTSYSQKTDSLLAQEQQAVAQVNASLQSLGVGINSYQMGGQWAGIPNVGRGGTIGSFGQNYGGFRETNFQGTDPTAVFSQFRFGAAGNDVLNRDIMDKSFASMDALATEVNKVNTFVNQTVPNLLAFGKATGSVNDAIKAITDAFDPAIATAKELGYAEADLSNARQAALDKVNADTAAQLLQLNVGTNVATRTAQNARLQQGTPAQIQGAENIALYAFDQATAVQARKQLTDTLTGLYGDTYKTTADYAKEMASLENQLGEQRLSIVDAYTKQIAAAEDQAKSQASGLITNLTQYALNLQTSGASPLSPQSQLDLSQNQFNAVASTAVMGNPTSLSQISQYSDSLLNAARTVYGSGQGYVDVFNRVVDTLSSISAITPDTLTADIFATETRTQTQVLNDALTALTTQVVALRNQVASNATMPARLAA